MGQTPHTLLSLRGYLYSLRGEEPLRHAAYGAAAGRRGEWGRMGCLSVAMFGCEGKFLGGLSWVVRS